MTNLAMQPGATTAGDNITIPSYAPDMSSISFAVIVTAAGGTTSTTATLVDATTYTLADNTATGDVVLLTYEQVGGQLQPKVS